MALLTERRKNILGLIIGEYVRGATPVASETIARRYPLVVSPATIRNDMAALEEDGFITRRHISGGAVPSDRGYRFYVDSLMKEEEVPLEERRIVSHLFYLVERELEEWNRMAAELLARMLGSVAIVSFPKASQTRLKHIELVVLQDLLCLLIVILWGARLKQQLIAFDRTISQQELTAMSNRLNAMFRGMAAADIQATRHQLTGEEEEVTKAVVNILEKEDVQRHGELHIEGLRNILGQPEFSRSEKALSLVESLEHGSYVRSILPGIVDDKGIRIIIGAENNDDVMRECSVVLARYGIPGEAAGAVGIVGPTRMSYERAVSRVRYMGSLLSALVGQLYRAQRAG